MTHTRSTARAKGPRTVYGPKVSPPESCLLTELGKRILAGADERTGVGKSNVVEHLLRLYGGSVTAEDFAPLVDENQQPTTEPVSPAPSKPTPRRRVSDQAVAV